MDFNDMLKKIGSIFLALVIVLGSVVPTSVTANEGRGRPTGHPAYEFGESGYLTLINETGRSESDLRSLDLYILDSNMEPRKASWSELDGLNGEYVLRLRSHDPYREEYDIRLGRRANYDEVRYKEDVVYARWVDPLTDYQPCPEVRKYIEILGLDKAVGVPFEGPTAEPGNLYGELGNSSRAVSTNTHIYMMMDPNLGYKEIDLNVRFKSDYSEDPGFEPRQYDSEFDGFKKNLSLYVHYLDESDNTVIEKLDDEYYEVSYIKAENVNEFSEAKFTITIPEEYRNGRVVAFEPIIELEDKLYYNNQRPLSGSLSYGQPRITVEADYSVSSENVWIREAKHDDYMYGDLTLEEYVKENNLESVNPLGVKCRLDGQADKNVKPELGPPRPGPSMGPNPEGRGLMRKINIGETNAKKLDPSKGEALGVYYFRGKKNATKPDSSSIKTLGMDSHFRTYFMSNDDNTYSGFKDGWSEYEANSELTYMNRVFGHFNDAKTFKIVEVKATMSDESQKGRNRLWDKEEFKDDYVMLAVKDGDNVKLLHEDEPGVIELIKNGYDDPESYRFRPENSDYDGSYSYLFNVERIDVEVNKEWVGKQGDQAEVELLVNGVVEEKATLSEENDWYHKFKSITAYEIDESTLSVESMDKGTFKYKKNEIEVREVEQDGYKSEVKDNGDYSYTIVNRETTPATPLVPAKTSVEVEKEWELFSKKAVPVTVELHADGKKVDDVVLSEENSWKHTFVDLPVVNDVTDESSIEYTVKEVTPDGFESTTQRNGNKFTIINKEIIPQKPLVPAKTKISVNKEWDLFEKEEIPVTVELHADGKKIDEVVLSDENDWKHTFTDLPVVNEITDEKAIEYTVHEIVPEGFEEIVEREGNVFTITNKEIIPQKPLIPAKTKVTVNKEWQLFQKDKMPVTVELHADGKKIDEVVLSNENDWTHTFTDLPVVNNITDEKAIEYTVHEIVPEGFEEVIEREGNVFTITNKEIVPQFPLVPGKTSVSVVKEWQLFQKDKQPVTVELLADGNKVSEVVLSDENDWKHTFTDLPVVNEITDDDAIVYTVREITPEGFESVITGDKSQGFYILNKEIIPLFPLTPGKTNVTVNKVWQLFQKDKMPVTVELHANGNKVDEVVLSDENEWTHTFTDLPVVNDIADESAIEYTVHEITPEGFESIIEGNADDGFIITNKEIVPLFPLFPGKTSVTVSKEWDLIALDKVPVTIELYADDVKVDEVVLSDENEWVHTFTDLPVVNDITDEKVIEYTVKEVAPEGFEVEIEEIDGVFIIRNKEIPVPEIIAEKKSNKEEIQPGEDVTYTIIVENVGTGSKLVNIKDPMENLIDDIEFIEEYVMVNDVPYTFSELMNGIDVEIQPGELVEVEFTVKFTENAEGEYINIAYVDEFEPEVPVTVTPPQPEYPDCNEPQDPNNPNPDCPVEPEYRDCNEPQDPNNPNPNCPVIPEEPEIDTPQHVTPPENTTEKPIAPDAKEDSPVDTGDVQHVIPVSLGFLGLAIAYALRKRKDD